MKYTIIADSCASLFPKDLNCDKIDFHVVPLTLIAGGKEFIDDEKIDVAGFIDVMNASKTCAKSACPNPDAYLSIMEKADNIIVVALSSKLSGTHASAAQAAERLRESHPEKKVYVQDTLSAATGLDLICSKLRDAILAEDLTFDEAVAKVQEISRATKVRFLLQNLQNLVKNGRLSKVAGAVLSTIKIKLICGDDGAGEIKKYGMALGTKRGLMSLAELPVRDKVAFDAPIFINHVLNEPDAKFLRDTLTGKGFTNIVVREFRGLSSLYAADKGIVMAY